MIKHWKTILLVVGILLLLTGFVIYLGQVTSCNPPASVWTKFSSEELMGFQKACNLNAPPLARFAGFLGAFVPGVVFFTAYWLVQRSQVKVRSGSTTVVLIMLLMADTLFVTLYGLIGYPVPGDTAALPAWVPLVIAGLGFLGYLALLAVWHWQRWGLLVFQASAVSLAIFLLLGGGPLLLAASIGLGVILLTLLLRPIRSGFR